MSGMNTSAPATAADRGQMVQLLLADDIPQMIIGIITILFAVSIAESHLGLLRAAATGIVCCIIGLSQDLRQLPDQGHSRQMAYIA